MVFIMALAISIELGALGQLSLKAGALHDIGKSNWVPHPYIVGGLLLYAVSALFYIYSLRNIPVSVAFPSVSISYLLVAYFAYLIWREPLGWPQIVAFLAIGFGVYMLFQLNGNNAARWAVARRRVDIRRLGWFAWLVPGY